MKILCTGAGGYIGSKLCTLLLNLGYEVRAVDNFHKGNCDALLSIASNKNFEFRFGDVTNVKDVKSMLDGVDSIIHLAAIVGAPASNKNPTLSYAVTYGGTLNILQYRKSDQFLAFASTGSVYGKVEGICTEESYCNPLSEYGQHKLMAEDAVSNEPNTVSFRFATAYGVSPCMRVNLLINDLVYQSLTNKCMTIFEADARRTFVHIDDMCKVFELAMRKNNLFKHKIYNVGNKDGGWTKREVAEYIRERTNCVVNYNEFSKDPDQRDYACDFSKIYAEGWEPKRSVEDGIEELIKVTPLLQIRHNYL